MSAKYGKVIQTTLTDTHVLRVYNNREWGEYVAAVFYRKSGNLADVEVGSHHDTDKEGVIRTGAAMLNQCVVNNITTRVEE